MGRENLMSADLDGMMVLGYEAGCDIEHPWFCCFFFSRCLLFLFSSLHTSAEVRRSTGTVPVCSDGRAMRLLHLGQTRSSWVSAHYGIVSSLGHVIDKTIHILVLHALARGERRDSGN